MRKISIPLSVSGIENAIKEFKTYTNSFDLKCERLIERLIEVGIPVIERNIGSFKGDSSRNSNVYFELHRFPNEKSAWGKLVAQNEDILFIEFGAGIYWNRGRQSHPQEREFGYGVGTYPGQTHAFDENGWWYWNGFRRTHSYGTESTMPVYNAYVEMRDRVLDIAREVFGNG